MIDIGRSSARCVSPDRACFMRYRISRISERYPLTSEILAVREVSTCKIPLNVEFLTGTRYRRPIIRRIQDPNHIRRTPKRTKEDASPEADARSKADASPETDTRSEATANSEAHPNECRNDKGETPPLASPLFDSWWAQQGSNLQPKDYESSAPPLSYRPECSRLHGDSALYRKARTSMLSPPDNPSAWRNGSDAAASRAFCSRSDECARA